MAFETAIITSEGYSILAQLTATKTLKLKHIFVDVSEHTAEDFAKPVSYWQGVQDTRVASVFTSVGADGSKSRIVLGMKIKPQYSDLTVTVKSIAVSACTLENGTEGVESIIYGLSDSHGIDVIANPSVSITSNVALDIIIDPASSITVEGGTNPNYALQSDLDRFVSCHKSGDPTTGQTQIIRGDKAFDNNVTFGGGFQVESGSSARIETVDGSYLGFYEDGSQFAFIGYEINDGGLVITGRESGAVNCESLIFGYIDDFGDAPNDPSYFMKMITNADNRDEAWIKIQAACVVPDTADQNSHDLGTTTYKWSNAYIKSLYSDYGIYFGNSSNCIEWDGESLYVSVYDENFMEFEGADQEIYFRMPIMPKAGATVNLGKANEQWEAVYSRNFVTRSVNGTVTRELQVWGGHYIDGYYSDTAQSISDEGIRLDFDYDTNLGKPSLWISDIDAGDPIIGLTSYEVDFQVPANVRSGIKMPYPATEGGLKLGCPCVLKATNGAQTAIKMGDTLVRDSSGWNVVRNNTTIAGVALYTCDFSGGNETFVNPLNYNAVCRLIALSSAANGAPFLAMMIER